MWLDKKQVFLFIVLHILIDVSTLSAHNITSVYEINLKLF